MAIQCSANQWTGFYMITVSVWKGLKEKESVTGMLMNLTLTVFIFKICKITCSYSSVEILFLRVVEAGHVLLQGSMVNVTHTNYLNRRSY